MKALMRIAFAIAIASPLTCQDDGTYFTLSSSRTFGSNDEPSVILGGVDVAAVQIRVYRVNDPVKFYSELEDAHSFGMTNPRQGRKRTWIEMIHDWKRALRRDIRTDLRAQFSEPPSAHFAKPERLAKGKAGPATNETYFAQAPVLNKDQLVLSFVQPVAGRDRWSSVTVPIRVKDKGVYVVEAVKRDLRAYTILSVSDMVMINKVGRTDLLSFLVDRRTGEPIPGVTVRQVDRHSNQISQESDSNGISTITIPKSHGDFWRQVLCPL